MRGVLLFLVVIAGCGDDECIFGQVATCVCDDGREGERECNVHGELGPCDCSTDGGE